MAINIRHECTLEPWNEKFSRIQAMGETRIIESGKFEGDDKFNLIYQIIKSYEHLPSNFFFEDRFDGIQSAGLGSSASAAVSMIGAFNKWLGIDQTREEIAEKAWKMEIALGWISGKQDQYAASFGGVNYLTFNKDRVNINPLVDCDDFVDWCVLLYTGKTRHSADIQNKLKERIDNGRANKALDEMAFMANNGASLIRTGQYLMLGKTLDKAWVLKKKSNPACTNARINRIYKKGMENGAVGGKVLGAGSEGHMLFIVPPKDKAKFIEKMKLQYVDFGIDHNGLEVKCLE